MSRSSLSANFPFPTMQSPAYLSPETRRRSHAVWTFCWITRKNTPNRTAPYPSASRVTAKAAAVCASRQAASRFLRTRAGKSSSAFTVWMARAAGTEATGSAFRSPRRLSRATAGKSGPPATAMKTGFSSSFRSASLQTPYNNGALLCAFWRTVRASLASPSGRGGRAQRGRRGKTPVIALDSTQQYEPQVCIMKGCKPSQSPVVTALPKGEPRAGTSLYIRSGAYRYRYAPFPVS